MFSNQSDHNTEHTQPDLTLAWIALALLSRNHPIDPLTSAPTLQSLRPILANAGCPSLLDGLPKSLLKHHPQSQSVSVTVQTAQNAWTNCTSPESKALLPSRLLQSFIPARTRRAFGAFYTPGWLVHLALDQVGWPSSTTDLSDPTCGAGAFLACAALAFRNSPTSLSTNAQRISGADIDPVAVLGARVACLCAVADLLEPGQSFEPDIRVANLFDSSPLPPSDIVVGNPPWIRFSEVDSSIRKQVASVAAYYDIKPKSAFHGGSELDLSAVCTYRMLDKHLAPNGKAVIVVPSSLLRSASAAQFRRFMLPDNTPLRLDHVTDFGAMRVFPDASNQTALLCWTKGKPTPEEVPVRVFENSRPPAKDASLSQAVECLQPKTATARFVGKARILAHLSVDVPNSIEGACTHIRGRKGITTDLNAAYFIRVLGTGSRPNTLFATNDPPTLGKAVPVHVFEIEEELVFPILKGSRSIHRFSVDPPPLAIIVPNRTITQIPNEQVFAEKYPLAYAHFAWVEKVTGQALSARSTFHRVSSLSHLPFYSIYNVGNYTFAPHKVVWAEIAQTLVAGYAASCCVTFHGPPKVIVPDHKVYFAPFDRPEPALFLCALLNSSMVRCYLDAITVKLQVGALLDKISLPSFHSENKAHMELVYLACEEILHGANSHSDEIDAIASEIIYNREKKATNPK